MVEHQLVYEVISFGNVIIGLASPSLPHELILIVNLDRMAVSTRSYNIVVDKCMHVQHNIIVLVCV